MVNPYLTEELNRRRQAELLREAQKLRETQGLAPQRGSLLARLRAWALQLTADGGRGTLWRTQADGRRGRAQRPQA